MMVCRRSRDCMVVLSSSLLRRPQSRPSLASWSSCDVDDLAVDKAGFIRSEKADDIGVISRPTNSPHRYNFRPLANPLTRIKPLPTTHRVHQFAVHQPTTL